MGTFIQGGKEVKTLTRGTGDCRHWKDDIPFASYGYNWGETMEQYGDQLSRLQMIFSLTPCQETAPSKSGRIPTAKVVISGSCGKRISFRTRARASGRCMTRREDRDWRGV